MEEKTRSFSHFVYQSSLATDYAAHKAKMPIDFVRSISNHRDDGFEFLFNTRASIWAKDQMRINNDLADLAKINDN